MASHDTTKLRIGDWCVNSAAGEISREGEKTRVDERALRLLLYLAEHAGEVVSIDALLDQVWPEVAVSQDSVYQAVTSLRRLLGDDSKQPKYIQTVPRLGYRMIAAVGPWTEPSGETGTLADATEGLGAAVSMPITLDAPVFGRRRRIGFSGMAYKGRAFLWVGGVLFCAALVAGFLLRGEAGKRPDGGSVGAASASLPRSVAVLPFLDLTEKMNEEPFADGMTEELIDRLSKVQGLRVPGATASFYFKRKQLPVAEIAKALGVAYVLDGSVRKSGERLRVATRLVRADNGYVVWSETYDRPLHDILMVQDDIAGEVTKALRASIVAGPGQ